MEKENEKVLASGPKGDETAAGENSNYGTELQKGGGRDELEEREEMNSMSPLPPIIQKLSPNIPDTNSTIWSQSLCSSDLWMEWYGPAGTHA
ncbi:unnamed protein product [Pleuronectes platessa]|uniref:Uncharacterized protein n=1 Tax=Pleuronectes platessa TaxID=8262 RepID=A0A9N7Z887_PLEPL|nr:unnamed protein product [Pleuronectes platessa]